MSRGKYSPTVYGSKFDGPYTFNAKGEVPPATWADGEYDDQVHFANYDKDGFDRYGYSAYYADGTYAGTCGGVDRLGYTELEYLCMDDDTFEDISNRY